MMKRFFGLVQQYLLMKRLLFPNIFLALIPFAFTAIRTMGMDFHGLKKSRLHPIPYLVAHLACGVVLMWSSTFLDLL